MINHLSSSQMYLYLQCSLKYKFQYIDKIPKRFKSSGLVFGSAVHSALSWFHKAKMNGNGVTLDRFYRIFNADLYSQKIENDIRYKNSEKETDLVVMGKEMLNLYFYNHLKEVSGSEIPFTIPLVDPSSGESLEMNFEGFIDLIERDDTIVEFKTSYKTMNQEDIDDHLQLTAYSYVYEMLYQKSPRLVKIVNFVKTKKPKMVVLKSTRNRDDYQRFFYLAKYILKGIESQVFFPRQCFMCKDCEYIKYCKEWDGK